MFCLVPEFFRYVIAVVIHPLVRCHGVERPQRFDVGSHLHVVEQFEVVILDAASSRIDTAFQFRVNRLQMTCQIPYPSGVVPFSEKKDAVDSEVVSYEEIQNTFRKLLPGVILEKRGMASGAVTLAIGYFQCQGNSSGYLLKDDTRHFGNVFYHLFCLGLFRCVEALSGLYLPWLGK